MERHIKQKEAASQDAVAEISEKRSNSNEQISDLQLISLFQTAKDAIIVFNNEGKIVDANPAFCSVMEQEKSSLIGNTLKELVPEEKYYKLNRQEILLGQNGKAKGILPIQTSKGLSYFEVITTRHTESLLNLSIMRDITHERTLEENLKGNKNLVQELFREAMDGIVLWSTEGYVITANAAACNIFECQHHEFIGQNFKNLNTVDKIHYQEMAEEFIQTGAVKGQIYLQIPNGKKKHIEFTCKTHSNEGHVITIFRDISERFQMERNLQESEQKFRRIFEGSIDGLVLWNNQFRISDINCAAERMFGLSKENVKGRLIYELFPLQRENKQELFDHFGKVLTNGNHTAAIVFDTIEGRKRHFDYSSKSEIFEGMNLTVIQDVSEKADMQEQLRKSDRLNIIGELAAGIAHEIRNPMTALKGFIQLLESSIKEEHAMYYQVITTELARIDSIINEFLILAKPQAIRFQEKDLNQIIRETVDLLNAQAVLFNVQFKTQYDENLPLIYCEPNQLKKVFINIIKNGIEVMPEGGTISIRTNRIDNHQIHISVQDEGMGIPKERIKKIGEPFYTTKEKGTGLGLMVSYKIIEEHKGSIEIESKEGKGTIFHITMPLDLKNRIYAVGPMNE